VTEDTERGSSWAPWLVASTAVLLAGIVLALAFPFDEVICSEPSVPGGAEVSTSCPQPSHLAAQLWIVAASAAVGIAILTVGYLRHRRDRRPATSMPAGGTG
jgi:hypothetical protein